MQGGPPRAPRPLHLTLQVGASPTNVEFQAGSRVNLQPSILAGDPNLVPEKGQVLF
jgi:hypothetical protein